MMTGTTQSDHAYLERLFTQALQNYQRFGRSAGECFHEELRGLAPDSPYTGMLDGVVCALEGAYDQALAAYNQALEHGPDTLMSVYVLKGIGLLLMTGNYREAVTAFAQAAKLLPRVQVFAKNKNKAMRVLEGMIPWPGSARP
ncbi:tetratricopeptide repeat protein [Ktedonobacter robiniae]|nr:tetratricopeptide repeat protein [Ktedonobacter robiniae]